MKNISIKLILFSCAIILANFIVPIHILVIAMLCALVLTSLLEYLENEWVSLIVFSAFILLGIINKGFVFFIPLIIYDLYVTRFQSFALTGIIPLVWHSKTLELKDIILLIIICICSYIIKRQLENDKQSIQNFQSQRDEQAEKSLILEEKLHELTEKQDAHLNIATLNERNRIAHEIHDNVGHLLSSSIIQLGAVMAVTKEEETKKNLNNIKDTLNKGMDSIRKSIHNIHDDSIDLDYELKQLTGNFFFCKIRYKYDSTTPPPLKTRYDVIAISKEALSNVIKHSNATQVSLNFFEHPEFYQLIIQDNGTKFSKKDSTGMGLDGIKQRVDNFKGILNITNEKGFRIFISIPKRKGEQHENSNN